MRYLIIKIISFSHLCDIMNTMHEILIFNYNEYKK